MALTIQLVASAVLMVVLTLVHAIGIVGVSNLLHIEERALKGRRLDVERMGLMASLALALFVLHVIEIAIFALFYIMVGAIGTFEESIFYSAGAYVTLGQPEVGFPAEWRVLGALEGLAGFLLIGWSVAVLVTDLEKILRRETL
ncbi:MAG: hypothetical protein H0W74_11155 [Sphingosinicella sp.]|nr:hypothetical protein [Sphingosinicella sp.]